MRGIVQQVSARNGFAAIVTAAGEYTIAELLGDEVEPGDVVDGNLESLGGETLVRVATKERLSVFIRIATPTPPARGNSSTIRDRRGRWRWTPGTSPEGVPVL
jgi:hypothetical protein